jgi:hypothetical protein
MQNKPKETVTEQPSLYTRLVSHLTLRTFGVYILLLAIIWSFAWTVPKLFDINDNILARITYIITIHVLKWTSIPLSICALLVVIWFWIKFYVYAKRCCKCSCAMCCTGIEDELENS